MNYPPICIDDSSLTRTGRKLISVIIDSYPGELDQQSNIVLRWGQRTELPKDKTTVIFDCGYFRRDAKDKGNRHYRLSINEYHPTNLPAAPIDRFEKLNLKLEKLYDSEGPIILVGRGGKTRVKQSSNGADWENKTLAEIKKHFPGRQVIYRPKSKRNLISKETLVGATADPESTVRDLCKGASLVVTQWSNIGNEAILYGIPVISEGGPASDVCPNNITDAINLQPLSWAARIDYFSSLAYWQWSVDEIRSGEIWPWLIKQIKIARNEN